MSPKNRYSIAYIPKGDIEKYYNDLTYDLNQKFNIENLSKKIPQHITLKAPFEVTDEEIKQVEEKIRVFIINRQKFNFKINDLSKFPGSDETIFLSILDKREIIDFRQGLIKELENFKDEDAFPQNYHPHISVASNLTTESYNMVWKYLGSKPKPYFDLTFDNATIIVKKDGIWSVYKTINL